MTTRIPTIFQDEINASEATKAYLDAIAAETEREKEESPQAVAKVVTKYGVDVDRWREWAAAAGYPKASWSDPRAVQKVLAWASDRLFTMFQGNWGLMAVAWRHGPEKAKEIQQRYAENPSAKTLVRLIGDTSSKLVEEMLSRMYSWQLERYAQAIPTPGDGGSIKPPAEVELKFIPEPWPEQMRSPRQPAGEALRHTLGALANVRAGGQRKTLEEALEEERQNLGMAQNVTPEDTAHLSEGL